jgi:hypothetical protein
MKYSEIAQLPLLQTLVAKCIESFNPIFTISEDQKAICFNGQPIVAKDNTVFQNGKLLNEIGLTILDRVVDDIEVDEHTISITQKMCRGTNEKVNPTLAIPFITQRFLELSEEDQNQFIKQVGFLEANSRFFEVITTIVRGEVHRISVNKTDNNALVSWFNNAMDADFIVAIAHGLRFNGIESYQQYFVMAESKSVITAFLAKYPHMTQMLRPIWEAHQADPEREIFSNLKTVADLERGEFLVEKYNQEHRYYIYSDARQKFLADAESWQWLLTQPRKTIDILMKHYCVNDKESNSFSYHSFGRTRENLSIIAKLKIDTKLAQAILSNLASDSISNDRFAININASEKDLKNESFHNGQKYIEKVKGLFAYMDHKGMDLDTRIKFINTFKKFQPFTSIDTHVWYIKDHKQSPLSKVEIIDQWVLERFAKLKGVNKNTFIPDAVVTRVKELVA